MTVPRVVNVGALPGQKEIGALLGSSRAGYPDVPPVGLPDSPLRLSQGPLMFDCVRKCVIVVLHHGGVGRMLLDFRSEGQSENNLLK